MLVAETSAFDGSSRVSLQWLESLVGALQSDPKIGMAGDVL